MKDINLLSQVNEDKNENKNLAIGKQLSVVFASVLLLTLIAFISIALIQSKLAADEAVLAQKIAAYTPILTVKKDIQVRQDKIGQLSEIIGIMTSNTTVNTKIIEGVAAVMPEPVFIINYAGDKLGNLTISGKAKDMDSIAYFVSKLKGIGLFSDVYLSNLSNNNSETANSKSEGYNFSAFLKLSK